MEILKELEDFDKELLEGIKKLYSDKDKAHDFTHVERILKNLRKFCKVKNPKKVYLAALVHGVQSKRETKSLLEKHFGKKLSEEALLLSWNAKKKPKTADEKILHDAELLDAFGAVGIARAYIKGGYENQTLKETTKILEKNIKREFLTETGRKLAQDRLAFTKDFLEQLKKEV